MTARPATVTTGMLRGVHAVPIVVEAAVGGEDGPPRVLGSAEPVVREAFHRVLHAFVAQQLAPPRGRPTLNLHPAGLRKGGSGFDLPMALALAGAGGVVPAEALDGLAALGEIALDGGVLPVRGAISVAIAARDAGCHTLLASPRDARLAAVVPDLCALPVADLATAIGWLRRDAGPDPQPASPPPPTSTPVPDLADLATIRGHETPKRALVVAAAGRHNLLFVGPPGSGKSALVRCLPGLLPPLRDDEALDVLRIHSAHGDVGAPHPCSRRPLRTPHHTSSAASLLGGSADPRPGEVTLAQHGALFLDELPEFRRECLEGLRQPLEEYRITIGRARATVTMPADFLLVGAMNPCPCGYAGDAHRPCSCTTAQVSRYRRRLSGPLLDRFDLRVGVPALDPRRFRDPVPAEQTSPFQRERVANATARQRSRAGRLPNGRLTGAALEHAVRPTAALLDELDRAMHAFCLSGRARERVLRVARTLADLDDRDDVVPDDVLDAARLRGPAP